MFVPLLLDLVRAQDRPEIFWYSGLIETNKKPICFAPDRTSSRVASTGPCSRMFGMTMASLVHSVSHLHQSLFKGAEYNQCCMPKGSKDA
jgi:hypothetical protein